MRPGGGSRRRFLRIGWPKKLNNRKNPIATTDDGIILRLLRRLHKKSQRRQSYYLRYLFYFSPLEILENGSFVVASFRRRAIFYGLTALYGVITIYRLLALMTYLSLHGLDLPGSMSFSYCIAMFGFYCMFYGVCNFRDMLQVLNQSHPQCMRQVCGLEDGTFTSLIFWLMRMTLFYIVASGVLFSSLFSLAMDSLPVCVYPAVKWILPDWEIPAIFWQIALYPVEFLSVVPVAAPAFICLYTLLIAITLFKEYVEILRKKSVSNLKEWKQVEKGYKCILVYNRIMMAWAQQVVPIVIVAAGLGMIGTMYATLTSFIQQLPFAVIYPVAAGTLIAAFTIVCMDVVVLKKRSDDVLTSLRERSGLYSSLNRDGRKEFILRGRALRPVVLPIGNFTDISMNVPVYVFEEVLNQILFLLSL